MFSAELPWCCFCAEIKVLGIGRNFLEIFYGINKKYWNEDPPEEGHDTSPSYLLFQTLLRLFWPVICMIWMELTRIDAVFSRIAMVLFLCRKSKFLELDETFWRFFVEYIKNTFTKNHWRGATQCPRGTRARPPPPGAPWYLVGPTWLRLT